MIRIEDFVAPHDGDEVFGVTEVDDVVGVAREHVDGLDVLAADFEFDDFIGVDLSFLDEAVACYYDEELPFGVVPVLAFGDAWFADVDADLAAVEGVNKFGEATAGVAVHFEGECDFFFWEIAEICGVEFLGETSLRYLWYHQCLWLFCKAVD